MQDMPPPLVRPFVEKSECKMENFVGFATTQRLIGYGLVKTAMQKEGEKRVVAPPIPFSGKGQRGARSALRLGMDI